MPIKLKNPEYERRHIQGPTTQIIAPRVTPKGDASGQAAMGQTFQRLGESITAFTVKRKERRENMEYAEALSRFQTKKIEIDSSFEGDSDYETYHERYNKLIGEARDQLSEGISNEDFKTRFTLDTDVHVARGQATMQKRAFQAESEYAVAGLQDSLQQSIEDIKNTQDPEDHAIIREGAFEVIETMIDNAYIDPIQAGKLKDKFDNEYSMERMHTLEPDQQLEALKAKDGWVTYLTQAQRRQVKDSATKVVEAQQEEDMINLKTMDILGKTGSYADRINAANKIKDPDVRKEVIRNVNQQRTIENNLKKDHEDAKVDAVTQHLINGGSYEELPIEQKILLPEKDRRLFEKLESEEGRPSKNLRTANYAELLRDYEDDPQSLLNYSSAEIISNYPDNKVDKILEMQSKVKSGDPLPVASESQINKVGVTGLRNLGIELDDKNETSRLRAGTVMDAYERQIDYYRSQNNDEYPDRNEAKAIMDELTTEIILDPEGWWDKADRKRTVIGAELEPDEAKDIVIPKEDREEILRAFQSHPNYQGKPISDDQIRKIYIDTNLSRVN